MAYLEVRGVEKSYTTSAGVTRVLGGIDLSLDEGEFVAVVGYSGSGKTTLVSLIGGLILPDAGSIVLDGAPVSEPGPERGMVFQQYSLLPWLSVYDNVAQPFSALDALTRATLQDELLRIWGERRSTVILVTNDVDEAILLADRIYPMTPGPGAMLGPVIEVGLERPRHRRHMSLTPAYQKARLGIVEFLRACRRGAAS